MTVTIRRIVQGIVALTAFAIAFFVLVIGLGASESRFACPGQIVSPVNQGTPATLHVQVEEYRWIVFWADHDAMILWEIQPGGDTGFGYYRNSSLGTPITDLKSTKHYGTWSSLSRRIRIETYLNGDEAFFEGICE
jgi:hypothetical protein